MIRKLSSGDGPGHLTRQGLQQLIAVAIACLHDRQFKLLLTTVENMVQNLRLPAEDNERWRIHLRNAHRYHLASELGAARYELLILQQVCAESLEK